MVDRRHFEEHGDVYDRYRPSYPVELADALAEACVKTEHALDVGCGTGQLSVLLASRFDRVTATDPSRTQIGHAKRHERVQYAVETAEKIGLPDHSADLIVAAQAAHWFEFDAFYAEARRVARRGAVLALISYGVLKIEGEPGERFHRFYWQDVHRFWPEGRSHVENGYKTVPFPFPEQVFPPLAIKRDWTLSEFLGYVETWSAVKQARKVGESSLVEAFAGDILEVWGDPNESRPIRWPLAGRLATLN